MPPLSHLLASGLAGEVSSLSLKVLPLVRCYLWLDACGEACGGGAAASAEACCLYSVLHGIRACVELPAFALRQEEVWVCVWAQGSSPPPVT